MVRSFRYGLTEYLRNKIFRFGHKRDIANEIKAFYNDSEAPSMDNMKNIIRNIQVGQNLDRYIRHFEANDKE